MNTYSEMFFADFPNLKAVHLLTYLRLLDLTDYGKNIVMPSLSKLAKEIGSTRQTMPKVLEDLSKVGLISMTWTAPVKYRVIEVL